MKKLLEKIALVLIIAVTVFSLSACGKVSAGTDGQPGPQGPQGAAGESAYEIWLGQGNEGSLDAFYDWLKGPQGQSAYEIWVEQGNSGTKEDFLNWLRNLENANPVVDIYVGYNVSNGSNVQTYFDVLFSGKINEVVLDFYYTNSNDELVYVGTEDSSGLTVVEGVEIIFGDAEYAYYNDKSRVIGYGNGFNVGGNYFDRITDGHYTFANYFKVLETPKNSVVYFTVKTDVKDFVYKITSISSGVSICEYAPAPADAISYEESVITD